MVFRKAYEIVEMEGDHPSDPAVRQSANVADARLFSTGWYLGHMSVRAVLMGIGAPEPFVDQGSIGILLNLLWRDLRVSRDRLLHRKVDFIVTEDTALISW